MTLADSDDDKDDDDDDDDVMMVENQYHLSSLWFYSFTVFAA